MIALERRHAFRAPLPVDCFRAVQLVQSTLIIFVILNTVKVDRDRESEEELTPYEHTSIPAPRQPALSRFVMGFSIPLFRRHARSAPGSRNQKTIWNYAQVRKKTALIKIIQATMTSQAQNCDRKAQISVDAPRPGSSLLTLLHPQRIGASSSILPGGDRLNELAPRFD